MRLWRSLLGRRGEQRSLGGFPSFTHNGVTYPLFGMVTGSDREAVGGTFLDYVQHVYKANGVVFACMTARQLVFSEARFQWQQLDRGRPGQLFGNPALALLEQPWPGGTTGDLLSRMIQDVDVAGNFFAARDGNRLRRLRPDWVEMLLTAPPEHAVKSDIQGYVYRPGGPGSTTDPVTYGVEQVAHWSPIPDPEAQYRGMSWLTPILREVEADSGATLHKKKFFDNAATPNMTVSLSDQVTREEFEEFVEAMNTSHQGARNAYKTLYLGGGADVKVVGADMAQLDFKATQGAGETRIAAAARVHPVIVGLSEGLQGSSLNAGNFNAARRSFADGTMRPLWRSAAGALEPLLTNPGGSRLWYDTRDIAYLQEDRKDIAQIQREQAQAIRTLVDAGFEPESAVSTITADNLTGLEHTGLFSVQLHPPGTSDQDDEQPGEDDESSSDGPDGGDDGEA